MPERTNYAVRKRLTPRDTVALVELLARQQTAELVKLRRQFARHPIGFIALRSASVASLATADKAPSKGGHALLGNWSEPTGPLRFG